MSDGFPKLGMTHKQVRDRLVKYDKPKAKMLKDSMVNQVKLCEGEKAAQDVAKEIDQRVAPTYGGCHTNFTNRPSMRVSGIGERKELYCPECDGKPSKSEFVMDKWLCSLHKVVLNER
jgi:hypothetical protein